MPYLLNSGDRARILKTGQTTSQVSGDDGDLQEGFARNYTLLTTGQYSGTTEILLNSKIENHTNNCVLDNNTGLIWSRTLSGPNLGQLPYTTTGSGGTQEGIYPYKIYANLASLSGYTDWRIPNINELLSIMNWQNAVPDSNYFNIQNDSFVWSSTNAPQNLTTRAQVIQWGTSYSHIINYLKTAIQFVLLVRG